MGDIFSAWKIGSMKLPNRLVRSATWEGLAGEEGRVTDKIIEITTDLAKGGTGLIIMGYSFIHPEGLGLPRQTGIHNDDMIDGMTRLVESVHQEGGRIAAQIVHAGGGTKPGFMPGRTTIYGPSFIADNGLGAQVMELSISHISDIVNYFADAAVRCVKAGFDAIEFHGAHGYLINQFLSPDHNKRNDIYGGSLENRARFLFEVYEAVRKKTGKAFPLFIKLNAHDFTENGFMLEEAIHVAKKLDDMGIDAIEVSGGVPAAGKMGPVRQVRNSEDMGYFLKEAIAIKTEVKCPVISVGGWRNRALIEKALDSIDAVSMSRPFIRQPDLANLWKSGNTEDPACISCGGCLTQGIKSGLGCVQELKQDNCL